MMSNSLRPNGASRSWTPVRMIKRWRIRWGTTLVLGCARANWPSTKYLVDSLPGARPRRRAKGGCALLPRRHWRRGRRLRRQWPDAPTWTEALGQEPGSSDTDVEPGERARTRSCGWPCDGGNLQQQPMKLAIELRDLQQISRAEALLHPHQD